MDKIRLQWKKFFILSRIAENVCVRRWLYPDIPPVSLKTNLPLGPQEAPPVQW